MSTTTAAAPAAKEKVDCVVIGAGVVGIAVARELALKGREVLVLDSGPTFGTGTSSRNSEVIHAGIYYPLNSLKVKIGKLIVATRPLEIPKLNDLMKRGTANGVHGLRMLEGFEAMKMEPELQCVKALLSPASGIVDSHSLMLSLVPELTLIPKLVVNSAGLSAPALAKRFIGLDNVFIPPAYYARGCYFSLANTKVAPFKHLIYPIPEDGGLGVHVTLDLDGQIKFGPDVEWIDGIDDTLSFLNRFDYSVNANRAERFYPEIRKYYPDLRDGSLQPSYAGIRPKLSGPRQSPIDFIIQGEDTHGVPGLVNLFGIESPGLTSSMAIAEYVAAKFLR
ncbi:L-2-hydroxyglutarate dehydrogenase [Citrus sinensis]|uniref:L-2-hydroxyglutarate dehydrogenase n=1 Tax=Citrus sinensis TaxID=2711 RepID=A0ACB8K1L0_CITSI|nr:L-2-hydroxyglutarate dehydrogenase [Citrus sinensis]